MKSAVLSLIMALLLAAAAGIVYVIARPTATQGLPGVSQTQSPSTAPAQDVKDILKAGGSSYAHPGGVYVFLYPSDYALDAVNEAQYTRISKAGETQRGQTELYDGVTVVFEAVNLEKDQTLEQWVDARIKESTADGTIEVTKPKHEVTVSGYTGYAYSARGLGEADYIILHKDPNSRFAVSITSAVSDPEKKGFQEEVEAIISTLQILK